MSHYKSNVRDLEFNLFEFLDVEKALDAIPTSTGDSIREMLAEAARLAEGPVAESFAETDRHPPTFDPPGTHAVSLPEPFCTSMRAWQQGEWFRIGLSEEVGGVPAPAMVTWAIDELVLGANPAVFMYMAGPIMANILFHIGNEQQRHWAALAAERNWCATMVLTEPDAAPTWVRAAPRRSTPATGPGTSKASNGSSPTVTPATSSRTSFIWCWRARKAPAPAPRA